MAKLGVRPLLFLALSAAAVLPVGLLGITQAKRWEQSQVEAADRQALAAARAAADQVSVTMQAFTHASETFAAQVAAVPGSERSGLALAIAAHVQHYPEFLGAYVADANGTSLVGISADGKPTESGLNYRDRDYFREIVMTGRTAISRVQLGRVTHVVSVSLSSPILGPTGQFLGITCTSLDLGNVTQRVKANVKGMTDGRVVLVDGEGRIIADSSGRVSAEPRDVSRTPLFASVGSTQAELRLGRDESGRDVRAMALGLGAPVPSWRVIATTPTSTVEAQGRQVRNQTALFALVLSVAALLLAGYLAAWLARPLRALARTADAVTRGELDTALPTPLVSAPREMQRLTQAISSMLSKLREHALELEALVARRTQELSVSNRELAAALETIGENQRRMREDIAKARLFQGRMLPALPKRPGLDIATHYAPLEEVSGDIYDLVELGEGALRVLVVDATGHGVQASMRTIFLKSAYDRLKLTSVDPSVVLSRLNELSVNEFPEGELHSEACCLDLRATAQGFEVSYANAGSTPLFVLSTEAPAREHYAGGPLLGVEPLTWAEPERFVLAPGELLLICSDGVLEQWNAERQRFDGVIADFRLQAGDSAQASLARLLASFDAFRGAQAVTDDLTLIAIQVEVSVDAH
jgi:serine phosphatase RsbU (regulator of sigma subunit)